MSTHLVILEAVIDGDLHTLATLQRAASPDISLAQAAVRMARLLRTVPLFEGCEVHELTARQAAQLEKGELHVADLVAQLNGRAKP